MSAPVGTRMRTRKIESGKRQKVAKLEGCCLGLLRVYFCVRLVRFNSNPPEMAGSVSRTALSLPNCRKQAVQIRKSS